MLVTRAGAAADDMRRAADDAADDASAVRAPPAPASEEAAPPRAGVAAAVALSSDHSPATRPDEVARIVAAGGALYPAEGPLTRALYQLLTGKSPSERVYHARGPRCGQGGLNMTRAIGDTALRPLVVPEPELTRSERRRSVEAASTAATAHARSSPPPLPLQPSQGVSNGNDGDDSEFVVLASDGLWDVVSNEDVADVVWRVAAEHAARVGSGSDAAATANDGAAVVARSACELVRCAQQRDSGDNITVLVARLPQRSE